MLISITEVGKEEKNKRRKNNMQSNQDRDKGILMKIRFSPNGSGVIAFR